MIRDVLTEIGPWSWLLLGFVLLGLELLAPGVFLVWFGIAALVVGGISVMPFADVGWWPWQAQSVAFVVLSALFAMMGTRFLRRGETTTLSSESPLNDRVAQLTGRTADLISPIENGVGRIRLGDSIWRVSGPDLGEGTRVKIVGGNGEILVVEPA